jgi:DNA-binding NtrC family response regulator
MESQKNSILAVDDEPDMLETYRSILSKKYQLVSASSGLEALKLLSDRSFSLILLDLKMPKMDGLELLKKIKESEPEIEVIMVTGSKDIASAVEAMKSGALDYVTKPFEVKELLAVIEKALERRALIKENIYLKESLMRANAYCDLIGQTPGMLKIFEMIDRVAPTDSTVLIHGESGTGKELVARALHKNSKRSEKPFMAINCAAIPENLLESELFGHERGAFTGALERKLGKFELAEGGTLFLDEIGCMSMPMQAKMLRVLENRVIERVGGEKGISIDVRILSATNIDFAKVIEAGKFRHDLYYRLNVIPIELIPLRERKEDIPLFVNYFLDKFNKELNKKIRDFSPAALRSLADYDWPGNIRELQNVIERIVVLSKSDSIDSREIPFSSLEKNAVRSLPGGKLDQLLGNYEKEIITLALTESKQNRTHASKKLGIARSTLNSRIEALGIS